jgi:hypothetical protein
MEQWRSVSQEVEKCISSRTMAHAWHTEGISTRLEVVVPARELDVQQD